jgi:hypothetical protein
MQSAIQASGRSAAIHGIATYLLPSMEFVMTLPLSNAGRLRRFKIPIVSYRKATCRRTLLKSGKTMARRKLSRSPHGLAFGVDTTLSKILVEEC